MSDYEGDTRPHDNSASRNRDIVSLEHGKLVDLSELNDAERAEIRKVVATKQIELQASKAELEQANEAMNTRLSDIADQVGNAAQAGASATVTGSYSDKMGRTEVIMGNTETAARGKLDRSQKGESDPTIVFVVIAAIVIVILAAIIFQGT